MGETAVNGKALYNVVWEAGLSVTNNREQSKISLIVTNNGDKRHHYWG